MGRPVRSHLGRGSEAGLGSPVARYWIYSGFVAAVFLLGGGARSDLLSLVVLRPLAVLVAAYGLWLSNGDAWRRGGAPLLLLACLAVWIAIQLLPLPPSLWTNLPGRAFVAANDSASGIGELWRPLSLAPSRTLNSLYSLTVPFAVLLLALSLGRVSAERMLTPIMAAAGVSAVLGLLQVLGPDAGPLYLYRITNAGSPVGLFANRNHHAMFLASLVPLIAHFALRAEQTAKHQTLTIATCVGSLLFIMPLVVLTGSRAGALLLGLALITTAGLWWLSRTQAGSRSVRRRASRQRRLLTGALLAAIVAMVVVAYLGSRSIAVQRLFEADFNDELRVRVFPQLREMASSFFPAGSGFGTFDLVYKVFEPDELLRTNYLNQAHNDAIQIVIEGGLPGVGVVATFLGWILRRGWVIGLRLRRSAVDRLTIAPFAWLSLTILLLGSAFDYPLRTPSLMAFVAVLSILIARLPIEEASERGR